MTVLKEIIMSFWFLLPAAFANMTPALFQKINFLDTPIDLNKKINGKPILGKNKTYRGLFFGTMVAIFVSWLQKILYPYMIEYSVIDYSSLNFILLGFLFGFGALFGDIIKSFFKRRLNILPGKPFVPFDQIDWIIMSLIFVSLYIAISWKTALISFAIYGVLHPISHWIGYVLGLNKNKI